MRNVWEKSKKCSFLLAILLLLVFQTTAFAKTEPKFTKNYEIAGGANGYFIAKNESGKYGLLDEEGEEAIPFEYDEMEFPKDTDKYEYVKVKQNAAYGILDYNGDPIIEVKYKSVSQYENDNQIAAAYNGNTTELFNLKGKKQKKELSGEYTVVSDDVFIGKSNGGQEDIKNEKDNSLIDLTENKLIQQQKDENGNVKNNKNVKKMGDYYVAQKYLTDGQYSTVGQLDVDSYVEIYQKNEKKADVMPEEDWDDTENNIKEQVSLKLVQVVSDHSILLRFEKTGDTNSGYYVIYNFNKDDNTGTFSEQYEKVGTFVDGKAFAVTNDKSKKLYIIDENGKRGDKEVSINDYKSNTDSLENTNNDKNDSKNTNSDIDNTFIRFKKDDNQFKLYSLLKGKEQEGVWKKINFLKHGYVLLCNEDDQYGIIDKNGKTVVKFGEFSKEELEKVYCASNSVTVIKEKADKKEVYYYQSTEKKEEGFVSKYKVIIIGAAIAVLLILIIVIITLVRRSKKKRREEEERKKQQSQRFRNPSPGPVRNDRTNPIYNTNSVQSVGRIVSEKAVKPQLSSQPKPQPRPQPKPQPQPTPVVSPEMKQPTGYLKGIKGVFAGRNISIKAGSYIRIGRSKTNNEIVLNSPKVSRTHCVVEYDARRRKYRVIDYSSNGTWLLDGRRLVKNQENWLDEGTVLVIGNDENIFELGRN